MKTTKGRLNTFPFIYKYFLKETIMISLSTEKVSIFSDGTMKRTKSYNKNNRNK